MKRRAAWFLPVLILLATFLFALPRPGVRPVKSVHMVRASFFSDADSYSLWASLTFDMPELHR